MEVQIFITKFHTDMVSILFRRKAEMNLVPLSMMCKIDYFAFLIVMKNVHVDVLVESRLV